MFEEGDRRNQETLDKHNRADNPLATDQEVNFSAWVAWAVISTIVVAVILVLVIQAFN